MVQSVTPQSLKKAYLGPVCLSFPHMWYSQTRTKSTTYVFRFINWFPPFLSVQSIVYTSDRLIFLVNIFSPSLRLVPQIISFQTLPLFLVILSLSLIYAIITCALSTPIFFSYSLQIQIRQELHQLSQPNRTPVHFTADKSLKITICFSKYFTNFYTSLVQVKMLNMIEKLFLVCLVPNDVFRSICNRKLTLVQLLNNNAKVWFRKVRFLLIFKSTVRLGTY